LTFIKAPPFGTDGHFLFSLSGIPQWTPMVDEFLKTQNLMVRASLLPLPLLPKIPVPPQLSANGRKAFEEFLAGAPHKAFAMAPNGKWGRRCARRTVEAAESGALANCPAPAGGCA
jgi:hypothetical protein